MQKPEQAQQIHVLVQRMLMADLEDPEVYQTAYELLSHLLRHVPPAELEYFLKKVPEEIEAQRHRQAVRDRRHLTLVT